MLSDAQSGLKRSALAHIDLPAPPNRRHLEIMHDGLRAIHGAGPGEDELADAACGQPAAGRGGDGSTICLPMTGTGSSARRPASARLPTSSATSSACSCASAERDTRAGAAPWRGAALPLCFPDAEAAGASSDLGGVQVVMLPARQSRSRA